MTAVRLAVPGFHTVPAAVYHADFAPEPSLSHSIARMLIDRSPRHAMFAHSRLSPDPVTREPTAAMEAGTVLHHLLLGGGSPPVIVAADSFRTSAAKSARDDARAAGRVPILADDYADLCRCAEAVTEQIREHPDCQAFHAPGRSEVAMLWREMDLFWCRGLIDRLPDAEGAPIFDLKSVATLTRSDEWPRKTRLAYGSQAAFYLRGARTLGKRPKDFRFILFEREPPYCIHVAVPGQTATERGEQDIMNAAKLWVRGILGDEWPGISTEAEYFELPPHETADARAEVANTQPMEQAA